MKQFPYVFSHIYMVILFGGNHIVKNHFVMYICIYIYIYCMALRCNKNVRNYRNMRKIRSWVHSVYCHSAQKKYFLFNQKNRAPLYFASWFNQVNIWIKLLLTNHIIVKNACCLFYKQKRNLFSAWLLSTIFADLITEFHVFVSVFNICNCGK